LGIETSSFRKWMTPTIGGQLALNPSGALARAQRLETVVIRYGT
jgi:hypothetical protein